MYLQNRVAARVSALLMVAAGILIAHPSVTAQKRARAVRPVPVVKVVDAAGLSALLKRENAKPLLVNYWATWCEPCREEFPDLVKIDSAYRSKGLDFIA